MEHLSMEDAGYWGTQPDTQWGRNLGVAAALAGLTNANYVVGDPNDPNTPLAGLVKYPPNYVMPRHFHVSARFEVVVTGSITIGGRVHGPGSIMRAEAHEAYGPHTVGPEGCVTVEVMTVEGARSLIFDTPDGPQTIDMDASDAMSKFESALAGTA